MITPEGCVVVGPQGGRVARGGGGAETRVKATGPETGGLLEAFEQVSSAGSGPPLHIHHECGEALYVLEGEVAFEVGSEHMTAASGTFVFVPMGVPHTYTNVGLQDARVLFWFTPAARMAGYFEELAELPPGTPGDQTLEDIASRHGVEIVRRC
jgi:mannose-6-phosphate isomerase-like protein (cupin superfamily)